MLNPGLFILLLLIISGCWPGPTYKDKDQRCKKWNIESKSLHGSDLIRSAKSLDVIDRYYYYICINGMNSYWYMDPDIFLDDAANFLDIVPTILNGAVPEDQLYLISNICARISVVKPEVVKQHLASIDALEAYAGKVKHKPWRDRILRKIDQIRLAVQ